jgi:hypothetical protein
MSESRVDRLLRLAEESVLAGEYEKGYNLVNIADTALEVQKQEVEVLDKMTANVTTDVD